MNLMVLTTNGGRMPVYITEEYFLDTPTHFGFYEPEEVNNFFFTDIIEMPKSIYSCRRVLQNNLLFFIMAYLA